MHDDVAETAGPELTADEQALVQEISTVTDVGLRRRPALAPRDRRVVTGSALIASGHIAHIPSHLHRARAHGLTPAHASEGLTHWAVYAGWPNVCSAVPVVKGVLETCPRAHVSAARGAACRRGAQRLDQEAGPGLPAWHRGATSRPARCRPCDGDP
jgi:alkylhydroperoxidase/carboxymuconolactone decarboxylase family protein YurZ